MEKLDIFEINKSGKIVSMNPYTQMQIRRTRQEGLEWRLTPTFIYISAYLFAITFTYHDMQIRKLTLLTVGAKKSTL